MSGINESDILLSICIPTFNRAEVLDVCLNSIVTDPSFCNAIEIIVVDNASSDSTFEVASSYASKYVNVKAYSNKESLGAKNFYYALSLGHGKYLKLQNDYSKIKEGALSCMLDLLKQHEDSQEFIFWTNQRNGMGDNSILYPKDMDGFVDVVSGAITWNGCFGCWKEQFDRLYCRDLYPDGHFSQMDWTLQILSDKKKSVISNYLLYDEISYLSVKRPKCGYNFFYLFIECYLNLLKESVNMGDLSLEVYRNDKKKIYKSYLAYWIYSLLIFKDKRYNFQTDRAWAYILKHYFWQPYFIYGLIYEGMYRVRCFLRKNLKCK